MLGRHHELKATGFPTGRSQLDRAGARWVGGQSISLNHAKFAAVDDDDQEFGWDDLQEEWAELTRMCRDPNSSSEESFSTTGRRCELQGRRCRPRDAVDVGRVDARLSLLP